MILARSWSERLMGVPCEIEPVLYSMSVVVPSGVLIGVAVHEGHVVRRIAGAF